VLASDLCELFSQEYEWDDTRPKQRGLEYTEHFTTPLGIFVGITGEAPLKDESRRAIVIIPGTAWQSVDKLTWLKVLRLLYNFGTHATRIDLCIDDSSKALSLDVVGNALERGCARSIRRAALIQDRLNKEHWTQYLGSRSSDKVVRLYDKEAESKGANPSIRLEVESKGKKAQEVAARLKAMGTRILDKSDPLGEIAMQFDGEIIDMVTGSIDFREPKEGEKNYARRTRCEFWQKFIDDLLAQPNYPVIKKAKPALEDTDNWIHKSVMPSLYMLRLSYGEKGFYEMIRHGFDEQKPRLSPHKKALIRQYHRDKYSRLMVVA
jgi:DNA relaxase NicK